MYDVHLFFPLSVLLTAISRRVPPYEPGPTPCFSLLTTIFLLLLLLAGRRALGFWKASGDNCDCNRCYEKLNQNSSSGPIRISEGPTATFVFWIQPGWPKAGITTTPTSYSFSWQMWPWWLVGDIYRVSSSFTFYSRKHIQGILKVKLIFLEASPWTMHP